MTVWTNENLAREIPKLNFDIFFSFTISEIGTHLGVFLTMIGLVQVAMYFYLDKNFFDD